MNDSTSGPQALDILTAALVSWTAASTQIVDHMASSPGSPSHSEITAILTKLVRGSLEPLSDRYAATDVELGAQLTADAIDTLMEEILLVPHDACAEPAPRNRAERRARRGRRP